MDFDIIKELDEESQQAIASMILQDRAIDAQIRAKQLQFTRPFIEQGFVNEKDFEGLTVEQIRAVIWQVRRCLMKTDPLWKVRIPRLGA